MIGYPIILSSQGSDFKIDDPSRITPDPQKQAPVKRQTAL
jgi:hypothetical protein